MKVKVVPKVKDVASHRGGIVRIDRKLPKKYHAPVTLHEKVEHNLMSRGVSFKKAHDAAEKFERNAFFRNKPKEWRKYDNAVERVARQNR